MEDYEEQLEIYISPTESNKRFTTLNPNDKNLVIELGLKLLDRGCKSYQILKNDEWNEKLTSLEESKNEEIRKLQTSILNKKEQLQMLKKNHKDELDLIKNQVEQKVKCIYESDIENLNKKINQGIKNLEEERKYRWNMQDSWRDKEDEKLEKLRREEEEKRNSLRKNYDTLLDKERQKCFDLCKRQENSTLLGQDGENFTYHNLNMLFPKSEVIDTHDTKQCGDFKLVYNNFPLMLEVKNYTGNVLKKEIQKFQRDIEYQKDMKGGIFISLKSGISARSDFQMEVYDGRPVIFLTYVRDNMEKIKLAVKLIEVMVKEKLDLKNEELVGGIKKIIPMIKRKWNTIKGTLENFKNKMSREILEQESNIIEIFKIIGMKY
tara:strand:- start:960 stop:2093 length:1134 start_codon:yes stop_codon:yes gene_type:complete